MSVVNFNLKHLNFSKQVYQFFLKHKEKLNIFFSQQYDNFFDEKHCLHDLHEAHSNFDPQETQVSFVINVQSLALKKLIKILMINNES